MNKYTLYKKELRDQLRSYLIVNSPIIIGALFLFSGILPGNFFTIVWLSFFITSLLIIARREFPRLPPFKPIAGDPAVKIGYVYIIVIIAIGFLYIILNFLE